MIRPGPDTDQSRSERVRRRASAANPCVLLSGSAFIS